MIDSGLRPLKVCEWRPDKAAILLHSIWRDDLRVPTARDVPGYQ